MADIQHLFSNISSKRKPSIYELQSELEDLELLLLKDRRQLVQANVKRKMEKIKVQISDMEKEIQRKIANKVSTIEGKFINLE
jgi:hypothetical protein